jgi:hypothetical protein
MRDSDKLILPKNEVVFTASFRYQRHRIKILQA